MTTGDMLRAMSVEQFRNHLTQLESIAAKLEEKPSEELKALRKDVTDIVTGLKTELERQKLLSQHEEIQRQFAAEIKVSIDKGCFETAHENIEKAKAFLHKLSECLPKPSNDVSQRTNSSGTENGRIEEESNENAVQTSRVADMLVPKKRSVVDTKEQSRKKAKPSDPIVDQSKEHVKRKDERPNELGNRAKLVQQHFDDLKEFMCDQEELLEVMQSHTMGERTLKISKAHVEALELACKEIKKYREVFEKALETEKGCRWLTLSPDQGMEGDRELCYLPDFSDLED